LGAFRYETKALCFQIFMLMASRFSLAAIRLDLKELYTYRNWGFLDIKKYVSSAFKFTERFASFILICDSFDALTAFVLFKQ